MALSHMYQDCLVDSPICRLQLPGTQDPESEDDPFTTPRRCILREKNSSLAELSKVDGKITEIESQLKGQASSSPATTPSHTRKKAVPKEVRVSGTLKLFISV